MTDLFLALAHHFLVFGLAALLAAEAALLGPALTRKQLSLLGNLDTTCGIFAGLILIVGFGRVFFGIHGSAMFLTNPWFWAKITAFVIVGILRHRRLSVSSRGAVKPKLIAASRLLPRRCAGFDASSSPRSSRSPSFPCSLPRWSACRSCEPGAR